MYWLNRTLCSVLEEMRKANESRNYSYLGGLIEEAQSMGNKMEAGLEDKDQHKIMLEDKAKLKKEIKELEAKKKELKDGEKKAIRED